ncbi:MAG: N-6 DNA methylase [Tateyamaria sp.]|uniref:N-6 DNA methylase n=1 Tax=Tateyamaria sp. TaxID=1929288 RepID=UPI0032A033B7
MEIDDDGLSDQIADYATLVAKASPLQASYEIGLLYACLLPKAMRSDAGMYFTPPALAKCLVNMATNAGTNWTTARVLEPSCGPGTVLLAALSQMVEAYAMNGERPPLEILQDRLVGQEKDPFCAWIAQVLVDLAVLPMARSGSEELPA